MDQCAPYNIEKEIVCPFDTGFVFHVSRGGDLDELSKVRQFITERAGRQNLKDKLHAIW